MKWRTRLHKPPSKEGLVAKEPVTVYCRVRPTPSSSNEGISCIRISPPSHVRLLPPPSALSRKEYQYTFRKVFEESAGQKDVFEEVALPLVQNLLNGRNSLLFTYGVTGSGKTYTMTGTLRDGGIMPRCLDAIFDSIASCQAKRCTFKPDRLNWFEIQPDGIDAEADLYSRIAQNRVKRLEKKNSDPDIAQRVKEEVRQLPVNDDFNYAVFVTYVEIYNNSVFDLLDDIYDENSRIRPPQTKIVREDSNHNMFVHGVNELEVGSTDEAFEAYFYGQKRRRIAQTALNAESSRSHSIFTIRLVHAPLNEQGDGVDPDPKHMIVSQLALVDLAGSERTNRTKNTGMRLKEAGNINNSLLTLRVCLELLRENQNGANKIIPYRDSRLTHLFRNFFDGDGQVSMIICISPVVEECDETMQVLKFAEMAQEVSTSVHTPIRVNLGTPKRRKAIQLILKDSIINRKTRELEKVKDEIPNKMAQAQQKLSQEHEKKLKTERSAWEMGIAVSNKRHRRSRSAGNDVWLEHRPVHEVPLNTIMQPNLPKRKSVTKLTDAKDVTEKTSKYCLMTQNADSDGDLETRLYKGDVIPTSGGGAQVMFNDVEVLRQYSPSDTSPSRKTPRQIREDLEAACAQSSDANQRKFLSRERRYYEV
ncbi:unnamed protein product [Nesidiocoris tenuis]|uniref:Kinesin-like protein n=1 Tax=Nesidiocoris tenuis TaxID=355587 RepID=A0A6H5H9M4_9HEMI|nr:unnamed protein product [Nesidiocoris tenuis]